MKVRIRLLRSIAAFWSASIWQYENSKLARVWWIEVRSNYDSLESSGHAWLAGKKCTWAAHPSGSGTSKDLKINSHKQKHKSKFKAKRCDSFTSHLNNWKSHVKTSKGQNNLANFAHSLAAHSAARFFSYTCFLQKAAGRNWPCRFHILQFANLNLIGTII